MITACAACGSPDLRPPSVAMEGKIPGYYAVAREMVCRSCEATTHPFDFDDVEAWKAFVAAQGKLDLTRR